MAAIVSDFLLEKKIESRIDKVEDSEVLMFFLGEVVFDVGAIDRYRFLEGFVREGSQLFDSNDGNVLNKNGLTSLLSSVLLV
jgi:hypothetical protein